jgi:hypothetical protein
LRFIGWVLHLPKPAWIRGAKVQILLTRIFYGLALFFLALSNVLLVFRFQRFFPEDFSFFYVAGEAFDFPRLLEVFFQFGSLILALALVKKRLFSFLIIAINFLIVLIHIYQDREGFNFIQGNPFGSQVKFIVKMILGSLDPLYDSWSFADLTKILSAILTIAGVIFAFSISNKNLPLSSPASIKPTPPQARIIPKTATGITGDAVEQVEKLGNLLAKGLLTQEEFDSKKKQILGL